MALTALQINSKKIVPGLHADGNGLYLRVQDSGAKSWIFRYQLSGERHKMGLGTLAERSAVEAREEAARLMALVKKKIDPMAHRDAEIAALASSNAAGASTFKTYALDYIEVHRAEWKNAKHITQWENTLEKYAYPIIGHLPPADVTTEHVLEILKPIWMAKNETAMRLRGRLETVLDAAKAKEKRRDENPARWNGHLEHFLANISRTERIEHHPALAYDKLPEFMEKLRAVPGVSALCLEFVILTASRSGEALNARWCEIDEENSIWIVPKERMKMKKEHRVPLTQAALNVIQKAKELRIEDNEYVFPGVRSGRAMTDMALTMLLRRLHPGITTHGFRSSFRDWAAEVTEYPGEMAEMALAHAVGNKVEAAYRRGNMFEKRKQMMLDWSAWCEPKPAKVVPIKKGNKAA